MTRFDHFFVTNEWDRLFRNVVQSLLARLVSDHSPISLEGDRGMARGPSPFCFENVAEGSGFHGYDRSLVARAQL